MANYLRPGKRIGIIGGGSIGFMLGMKAKEMGFDVYVLDSDPKCPAHRVADMFFEADFNDISALERIGRICDIVTYTTTQLEVDLLSDLSSCMYLPQTTDLLALVQDQLLFKNFLTENLINTLPYATIVMATDIEEKIKGIGYPCYLRATRSNREILLQNSDDMVDVMDFMNEEGTCLLEAALAEARHLSVTVMRNGLGQVLVFPVVEHEYRINELYTTIASNTYLSIPIQREVQRIARVIATKLELHGTLTIDLEMSADGMLFVKDVQPMPTVKGVYSQVVCGMDVFEAHIRSLCDWPLPEHVGLYQDAVIRYVMDRDETIMQKQISLQPTWQFAFYHQTDPVSAMVGHIAARTNNIVQTMQQLETYMEG